MLVIAPARNIDEMVDPKKLISNNVAKTVFTLYLKNHRNLFYYNKKCENIVRHLLCIILILYTTNIIYVIRVV